MVRGVLAFAALAIGVVPVAGQADRAPCGTESAPPGVVRAVLDGRTVVLEDGRTVRLEGIDVPAPLPPAAARIAPAAPESDADPINPGPAAPAAAPNPPPEAAARAFLASRLPGKIVTLRTQSAAIDRYQRVVAYIFVNGDGLEASVQHDMIQMGFARVAGRVVGQSCAASLLVREGQARQRRDGLWADPGHAVLAAGDPASILPRRGRFELVEGRVLSVRESGGTIYVNFGRRWSEDFTATIAKRNEKVFAAAGGGPKRWERQRVRVRGVIEERGGPWIELTRAEQVEVVGN